MNKLFKDRSLFLYNMLPGKKVRKSSIGLPPGSIIYTGSKVLEEVKISSIIYDSNEIEEKTVENIQEFFSNLDEKKVNFLIVEGIHKSEIIEEIGKNLDLHYLAMEDIANVHERTKIQFFDNFIQFIMKRHHLENYHLRETQVSIILTAKVIVVFLESSKEILKPLINRITSSFGRIRRKGIDYLFYAIIDLLVDYNFQIIEEIMEKIESIEEELIKEPTQDTLINIQHTKRVIINLRKNIYPVRELLNSLIRDDSELITESTKLYFRDVYDHVIRINENLETYRETVSGLLDIYLSSISNKMNEIMKVLTIIATIFIPLTFIAGIYGMNFQFMPELTWKWSYLIAWIVMIIISGLMVIYFRRKKWI